MIGYFLICILLGLTLEIEMNNRFNDEFNSIRFAFKWLNRHVPIH